MSDFVAAMFDFVAGLTFCGIAGSLVELASGQALSLKNGLVSRQRLLRSFAIVAAVGPFMLTGDMIAARRAGSIGLPGMSVVLAAAFIWTMASGILVFDLALTVCGS